MKLRPLLAAPLLFATPLLFAQQSTPPPNPQGTPNHPGPPAQWHRRDGDLQGGAGRGADGGMQFHRAPDMRGHAFGGHEGDMGGGMFALRGLGLPRGEFWKNTGFANHLGLTPDQITRLDNLWLQSQIEAVHMRASLQEEELLLQPLVSGPSIDQNKVLAQVGKIADTRASIEKADVKAMLSMRAVLAPAQWSKLHSGEHYGFAAGGHFGSPGHFGPQNNAGRPPVGPGAL